MIFLHLQPTDTRTLHVSDKPRHLALTHATMCGGNFMMQMRFLPVFSFTLFINCIVDIMIQ